MNPQPLLNFLHTLPPIIVKAPPAIGVSAQAQVKVLLLLDHSKTFSSTRNFSNLP
jgi:hypothetical protein